MVFPDMCYDQPQEILGAYSAMKCKGCKSERLQKFEGELTVRCRRPKGG